MKFGLVHRLMTDALAALGLMSLVTSGELDRWISVLIVVGLAAAMFIPERLQDHQRLRKAAGAASLLLLAAQVARLTFGEDVLALTVEFAAGLQVIRLATRRGAAHDQQIILLALLHLVAGTVLGGGLAYGLCFLGFLVIAPGALVLSHLRREVEGNYRQGARDRTGLPVDVPRILRSRRVISRRFLAVTCSLSIPIFLFTAVLFVLFPRVGLSLLLLNHSRSTRMIGFSDRVDLGGVGKLRSDPAIAMRIHFSEQEADPPARIALYLRGTAFDSYDGRSWARSKQGRYATKTVDDGVQLRPYFAPVSSERVQIDLEPINPPVLFLPPDAVRVRVLAQHDRLLGRPVPVFAGTEGDFRYAGSERGIRYEVMLSGDTPPPPEPMTPADRARYLAVPPTLSPRISELARSWAGTAAGSLRIARRVEHVLRSEYSYDLESPSGGTDRPLEHFLFDSKRGHCEFYSTAMAMMLRTLGVPSRNVTGFIGGTYNRFGQFYAVRQGDAHSWVEAYIDGIGWHRFDPTPPANAVPQADIDGALAFMRDIVEAAAQRWNRHVVGYDLDQQMRLLRSVSRRYSSGAPGGLSGLLRSRRALFACGGLLLLLGSWYWWHRTRSAKRPPPGIQGIRPDMLQIVALYRALEGAMAARGVPRVSSTPPLAHARALRQLGHPASDEIYALTELYLGARYGGEPLTEGDRKAFSERVRALRQDSTAVDRRAA